MPQGTLCTWRTDRRPKCHVCFIYGSMQLHGLYKVNLRIWLSNKDILLPNNSGAKQKNLLCGQLQVHAQIGSLSEMLCRRSSHSLRWNLPLKYLQQSILAEGGHDTMNGANQDIAGIGSPHVVHGAAPLVVAQCATRLCRLGAHVPNPLPSYTFAYPSCKEMCNTISMIQKATNPWHWVMRLVNSLVKLDRRRKWHWWAWLQPTKLPHRPLR